MRIVIPFCSTCYFRFFRSNNIYLLSARKNIHYKVERHDQFSLPVGYAGNLSFEITVFYEKDAYGKFSILNITPAKICYEISREHLLLQS